MTPIDNHFDEMSCLMYLEGQLDRSRALALSAHTETCAACRALLRALEHESKSLAHALLEENESVPARLLSPPARERTPWGWIVSFGLGAAGAYTVWTGIDQLQQQLGQAGFGGSNLFTMLLFSGAFWKGWGSMANFIEILAITTLGIVAIGLLRRARRRWTTLALVMSALALALGLPQPAGAAEVKKVQNYILEKGQTLHNDLMVFGATVRIDGTVDGDVITFGEKLTVSGHVTGDVISFSRMLVVSGQVDGNIRGFTAGLNLQGSVGKNVTVFGQNLDFDSGAKIGGSMTAFTNDATLDGRIGRDLMIFGNLITLSGSVGGKANVRCERFSITSSAEIDGPAQYKGRRQPEVDSHAKLASPLEVVIETRKPDYTTWRFYLHEALRWGAAFVFGLVLILIMPSFFGSVVGASRRYLHSILLGFAVCFGVPIITIISAITIVGLGVGIASLLLWIVAIYAAQTFISVWLGELLLKPIPGAGPLSSGALIGRMALGLVILRVVYLVPYLGAFAKFVVICWGLGALALTLYRKQQPDDVPLAA